MLGAVALAELASRQGAARAFALALGAVFLCGSAVRSFHHQEVWRDDAALWQYEAYRSSPSLLGIQSLARSHMKHAEMAESPAERAAWLERGLAEVERGFERNAEMARVPSRYGVPETLHLARLHYLRGRIAELAGEPPAEQMVHHRRAFELAPERLSAIYTSRTLFEMAASAEADAQQQLVESSFDYFVHYLEMSAADPLQLAEARELLEHNWVGRFPWLDGRVEATRRSHTP